MNEELIEQLYTLLYPKCVNYAYIYLKDRTLSEDIVQEAIMSLWQKRDEIDPDGNIEYYLLSTVRNKALNHIRDNQTKAISLGQEIPVHERLALIALSSTMPDTFTYEEMSRVVDKTVNSMNSKISSTFLLHKVKNMSYKEISVVQDISVKSVEYRISKALKILRNALKEYL